MTTQQAVPFDELTRLASEFVTQQQGMWDHSAWLDFLARVQGRGIEMSADMQANLGGLLEAMKEYHTAVSSTEDMEKAMSAVFENSVDFVTRHQGVWGHGDWKDFVRTMQENTRTWSEGMEGYLGGVLESLKVYQAISPKARLVSYCVDITEVKDFLDSPWKPAPLPIDEILTRAELEYTKHATGHLEVTFDQKDDEKQSVFVTKDVEYFERADVGKVWSLAATVKEAPSLETTMKLLQQSARTKLGAWTVERDDQGQYLIIYCVKLDATASPGAVKSTMEYVAKLTSESKRSCSPRKRPRTPHKRSTLG